MAGLRGDYALLAAAHQALSEQVTDREQAAAHSAAEGRAWLRLGDKDRALARFRRVLELSPTDAYAVAVLEALLVERGETTEAVHLLRDAAAAEHNAQRAEQALLHAGAAAELAGRADLAARSYEDASDKSPGSFAPLWLRLRLAERTSDRPLELASLQLLATREASRDQPGIASLELAERLAVDGARRLRIAPLSAALGGDMVAYEAAVSAVLAPRDSDDDTDARALRVRALGALAQQLAPELRPAIEHEQLGELMHDAPADARTLLIARAEHAELGQADELLALLLTPDTISRAQTAANLGRLVPEPEARAELALHALRMQRLSGNSSDDEQLVAALALMADAPDSLAAAIALGEAIGEHDAAEVRVTALQARLRHTPEPAAASLRAALARAYLEADRPADALALARELSETDPEDLAAWEALHVAAQRAGAWADMARACDRLADACTGATRARLLEEAAALLHEQLEQPAEAELRVRAALMAEPTSLAAFERLHDLLLDRGDLEALDAALSARTSVAVSTEERVDLAYSRARILRALGRRDAALDCTERVLQLEPLHPGALGLAAEIHAFEQSWEAAVSALSRLAMADVPASQRRLAREGAADFLERKLKDTRGAYAELAKLADEGLADLTVYSRMADVAQRAGLASECVQALGRAAALAEGGARAAFERRAALLHAQSLGQPEAARDALLRALAADPLDVDALEALHAAADSAASELTSSEMLLHELWSALRAEPADPRLLRILARVARLRADATLEYIATSSLCALALELPDEHEGLARLRTRLPALPSGTISDVQFALLGGPTHAHAAFRIARIVCRSTPESAQWKPAISRRTRVREASPVYGEVYRLTRCFGLDLVELHQGDNAGRDVTLWSKNVGSVCCLLSHELSLPLSAAARFSLGSQCAALRLGVLPLVRGDRGGARDLLLAALCMGTGGPVPTDVERLRPLAAELAKNLSRKERRELDAALAELPDPLSALLEVGEDARAGAYRAGTLLAMDVAPALGHVFGGQYSVDTIINSKLGLRLLRFWTSQTCLGLLRGLGMTA
jgi:tetratricopeptide (TPR) repeat protein